MFDTRPRTLGPVSTLEATLLQTVKGFCVRNRLDIKQYEMWSDGRPRIEGMTGPMIFEVAPRKRGTPRGYAINIHAKRGVIPIPAGGQIFVSHDIGRVTEIASMLPLRRLSFAEVMALAKQIDHTITSLGYGEPRWERRNRTEDDFHEQVKFGNGLYANWKIDGEWVLELRIRAYSSFSHVAFTTPIGSPPDATQEPESYLLDFYMAVDDPIGDEMRQLKWARRLALTGSKDGMFPVKIWFDDPDWRPPNWQGSWIK